MLILILLGQLRLFHICILHPLTIAQHLPNRSICRHVLPALHRGWRGEAELHGARRLRVPCGRWQLPGRRQAVVQDAQAHPGTVLYYTVVLYCIATVLYCTVLIQAVPFNTKYTAIMETIYDASEHAKKVSPYTSTVGEQNDTTHQKAATKAFLWST